MTVDRQKSRLLIATMLISTLLVGCKGNIFTAKTEAAEGEPPLIANVAVMKAERQAVTLFDELQGRVVAFRTAEIRPQVSGIITERLFKQGEMTANNQALFQINKEPFVIDINEKEASLAQAKVNLEQTQRKYSRLQALDKTSSVSKQAFEEAEFNYKKAAANVMQNAATLEQSKLNFKYATIRAPISGIIEQALVTEGTLVNKGDAQALAIIKQIDKVYIDVRQPASKLPTLRKLVAKGDATNQKGLGVNIMLSNDGADDIMGKIVFSGISVDVNTGDLIVRILADNQQQTLLPGMYVRTEVPRRSLSAFLLPQQAIQRASNGDAYVVVITSTNQAEKRTVTLAGIRDHQYVVSEGIKSGDAVIIEGHENVMPSAQINASQWQSDAQAA
ncbi:efflux RND transporter periplasmic adaptor subunit [Photobacterium sanguinicancri]|uniref:Efflux RND transporter periplasmic adaptor subunit n=1 Tax=Photobacterium sanguinicancri TaxID=875932 RepID=A0AAW7Y7Z9_9GAMM|nr:efflux RND transporter periplasmic adaptor subunit [Photobacterium sanguinicancri]MDO6543418.1 efflux RND transporter periplasmic adaptor subunit [Photobacterium sanguinicancri]